MVEQGKARLGEARDSRGNCFRPTEGDSASRYEGVAQWKQNKRFE